MAAFDLDGTILDMGIMSRENSNALSLLRRRGMTLVLATGRHLDSIPNEIITSTGASYVVSGSGSAVDDIAAGKRLCSKVFEDAVSREIVSFIASITSAYMLSCNKGIIISNEVINQMQEKLPEEAHGQFRGEYISNRIIIADPGQSIRGEDILIDKIEAILPFSDRIQEFCEQIKKRYSVECIHSMDRHVEITPKGVDKASGMRELCGYLGINADQVIAFGDSGNDEAMLRWAGYSVAMGNAHENIKQIADYVTTSVSENGAAAAIDKLLTTVLV